jgi:hypothetical protein
MAGIDGFSSGRNSASDLQSDLSIFGNVPRGTLALQDQFQFVGDGIGCAEKS